MPRRITHSRNIFLRDVGGRKYIPGDIIQFIYRSEDIYDRVPNVFVLKRDDKNKIILGININYLSEYEISRLLKEINFKKMKYWNLYKDSYRTYSIKKMSTIKVVEYKTNKMLAEERKQQRENNE
jgi:hypothetical protein|tara:strand:+ start:5688 stop:6062 length:375 start_codon:yes stop_codon:yes gene_type:complete